LVITGIGHSPTQLINNPRLAYSDEVLTLLYRLEKKELVAFKPGQVISGASLGWDTALALAGFSLHIPVILAILLDGQEERWTPAVRMRYRKMLERAEDVHFLNDAPYEPEKIRARNEWMVAHADLILALWDGRKSGDIWNMLAYAQFRQKMVKNLWRETNASDLLTPILPHLALQREVVGLIDTSDARRVPK
jgi:hypothetical protein